MLTVNFFYAGAAPNGDFQPELLMASALEPNRLMPVRWSAVASVAKPITPIVTGTMSVVWSPKNKLLLVMPVLAYNIRENWDLDLTGQIFFLELPGNAFSNQFDTVFFRLRWSY